MDQTGVGLVLPRIADHFDASIPVVQWVTLGYMLTTGALLMPMGRLADMIGRKRVYTSGFALFTVSALLAGSSPTLVSLIGFKVLQGVGAAMVQSTAMAIATAAFSAKERGKAIGTFVTAVGLGAIAGPVFGGGIASLLGWRYVFFAGIPLGLVSIGLALLFLEGRPAVDEQQRSGRGSFDWLGSGLSAATVAIFLLAMTNAYRVGWGSPLVASAFAGVVALFVSFIWWERRAPEPMLALELFSRRLFSLGSSASFLTFIATTATYFLMPFYLQKVLGFAPGQAGIMIVPAAICFALTGAISGRLSDRFGWRRFAIAGLVVMTLALLLISRLTETSSVVLVIAALMMQGLGTGTFFSPNASAVLSTVERARYGVATAFLNMIRNTANVTGVALATAIVTAVMASQGQPPSLDAVSSAGAGAEVKAAFMDGLQVAYLVMSGVVAVALVLTLVRGRPELRRPAAGRVDRQIPSKT